MASMGYSQSGRPPPRHPPPPLPTSLPPPPPPPPPSAPPPSVPPPPSYSYPRSQSSHPQSQYPPQSAYQQQYSQVYHYPPHYPPRPQYPRPSANSPYGAYSAPSQFHPNPSTSQQFHTNPAPPSQYPNSQYSQPPRPSNSFSQQAPNNSSHMRPNQSAHRESEQITKPVPEQTTKPPMQREAEQKNIEQSRNAHRETEEERRERKKREYEIKRQRENGRPSSSTQVQQRPQVSQRGQPQVSQRAPRVEKKPVVVPDKAENRLKRNSTFLCKIKFRNELPDPVSQPKLLRIFNDKDRYSKYSITSMEKTYKHKLFVEPDLGIPLDLLDLSVYNPPKTKQAMDPADAELLVDDEVVVKQKTDSMRRRERPTDKGVAWLVKTTYISPVSTDPAKQSITEKQAKELREQREGEINDREHAIQAIEESFRISKLPPTHLTKPELKPVEVLPLLPDFDRAGDQFVHVVFDTEPTADTELYRKLDKNTRDYLESRAVLKSCTLQKDDGTTERFLGYVVPTLDEANDDDDEIPYSWIREYHWDFRTEDARNNFVLCFGEDSVQYLPINSKLMLRKKKAREGRSKDEGDNSQFLVPSSVTVRRRDLTDEEEDQREVLRRTFMEGASNMQLVVRQEEDTNGKRKRGVENERGSKRRRGGYEEETREVSEDEDEVSI